MVSCGSGDGQFRNPFGAAVDGSGNVHVTDSYNHRVQKFAVCDPTTLIGQVEALNLQNGISNSLDAKLANAVKAHDNVNQNNHIAAINKLQAFINEVEAQSRNHIPNGRTDALIATAQQLIDLLTQRTEGRGWRPTTTGNRRYHTIVWNRVRWLVNG